ncbi:conserved hypothetical protein [Rubrivivax sp. A210]|uniref:hypothetical protein n=1 Tax=Rubrivivax sp. A210 TaxID=2772301 RepID=UPI0019195340|nr:hypothetical protein [Rubrivivax sp. A210]CAD5367262.1 conserved hypothetical protein [Rubrivivax sp. A210]
MDGSEIFAKTPAGSEEMRSRDRRLPQRLRTLLIMVDGTRTAAQLQAAAATIGAPDDAVQMLVDLGLIAAMAATRAAAPAVPAAAAAAALPTVDEGERFRVTQKFMNDTAVDLLGFRAFLFTLKLEKCYTRADLLALMPDFNKALAKASGAEVARVLELRARELLG